MHSDAIAALAQRLPDWYRQAGRDLPWRKTSDPYAIWVSEIMLQQTRVEAVRGYYHRFLEALPTVQALAEAPDDRLRKLWEGLGYYTRVMNMKKAANVMVTRYGGRFPQTYPEVLALPGVGEYTAGAVCSIAFGLPTPAVDGNVLRVLSRLLADPRPVDLPQVKAEARQALAAVYPAGQCAVFTQALMELGATVCLPRGAPKCSQCPMADLCQAREAEQWRSLPARLPKSPGGRRRSPYFSCAARGKSLWSAGPSGDCWQGCGNSPTRPAGSPSRRPWPRPLPGRPGRWSSPAGRTGFMCLPTSSGRCGATGSGARPCLRDSPGSPRPRWRRRPPCPPLSASFGI